MGEWHGVETNSDGRVVSLVLPDNSVKGMYESNIEHNIYLPDLPVVTAF